MAEPRTVVVSGSAATFRQDVVAGGHSFVTDEPVAKGGEGAGPDPYDLLSAALGSCTSMTLGLYARRKQWPLESVTVHVTHENVARSDANGAARNVDVFTREIELVGPLDDEQRARLLEIANKCPVHRTLSASSEISTRVKS